MYNLPLALITAMLLQSGKVIVKYFLHFVEAFYISVKNEKYSEEHKLKLHEQ